MKRRAPEDDFKASGGYERSNGIYNYNNGKKALKRRSPSGRTESSRRSNSSCNSTSSDGKDDTIGHIEAVKGDIIDNRCIY
jgi:hypothetical protein